jgi:hypothetical protein
VLGERSPVDGLGVGVQVGEQLFEHRGGSPRAVEVGRDVAASGGQVGDDGRGGREPVEVLEGKRDARLVGDREQMEDAVGRAARAGDPDDRIFERVARRA